jgi:S1-C subfamily serine protease
MRLSLCLKYSIVIAIGALVLADTAMAEELSLQIPSSELSIPGVAEKIALAVPAVTNSAASEYRSAEALSMKFRDAIPHTRGAHDISIFRDAAPSVVLILTKNGLGTGSFIQDNVILTSLHVLDHNREVTVVFKPSDPNGKPNQDEIVKADAIKIDVQRDLALVRPRTLPNRTVRPLQISLKDVEVGADVAAIGHPKGEDWTFTKGIVSSIRPDYEWSYGAGDGHRATVIQTQTPINPGNSDGPLLSEDGKIIGVNSFGDKSAQGLNFAVAAKELIYFLKNQDDGLAALNSCNQSKTIFEGRNQQNTAFIRQISLQCDDTPDIILVAPDNKREPFFALVDLKRRGKAEGIVFDLRRTGSKWDTSIWDPQVDETFPLKGIHPDGKLMPTSFVERCGKHKPLKDLKCA